VSAAARTKTVRHHVRRVVVTPVQRFMEIEAAGGLVLVAAAVVAIAWANGPFGDSYHDLWTRIVTFDVGPIHISEPLEGWVNDALMTIFFFVVGLEIKREAVTGELRDPRTAALPIFAALGGMIVPAGIYFALNGGGAGSDGWGIPVATDIAFAVGILTLLGRRVPTGLKIFLLTLAVADDIGGIVIIAIFYTADLSVGWLLTAFAALGAVGLMRRIGIPSILAYVPVGAVAWYAMLESGVHATIAGVILGLITPAHPVKGRDVLHTLEDRLAPWSSFLIVPIFALANAGVELGGGVLGDALSSPVTWGVTAGLLVGKTVGITIATLAAARIGIGRLPVGVGSRHVVGVGILGGVGFTVALFIAALSFPAVHGHVNVLLEEAKIGVFVGSLASGLLGAAWLLWVAPRPVVEATTADSTA